MRRFVHLGTLAVFAAIPVLAQAQNADDQAVRAANAAFYAALSGHNEAAMDPLWVHAPYAATIHPISKVPVIGWEAVRNSFADVFKQFSALTVTPGEPTIHQNGNTAWVIGTESFRAKPAGGSPEIQGNALVTNIYENQDGHWLMVDHHASAVPQ